MNTKPITPDEFADRIKDIKLGMFFTAMHDYRALYEHCQQLEASISELKRVCLHDEHIKKQNELTQQLAVKEQEQKSIMKFSEHNRILTEELGKCKRENEIRLATSEQIRLKDELIQRARLFAESFKVIAKKAYEKGVVTDDVSVFVDEWLADASKGVK